jgi:CHASE3 domain sensor protein
LSLRNKTNIAFFAALITLAIIGWFSLQTSRSTAEEDHLVAHSRDVLESSELLRSHIYDAAAARRAYSLWAEPAQLNAFDLAYKSSLANFAALRKLTIDDPELQANLSQIEPLVSSAITSETVRRIASADAR